MSLTQQLLDQVKELTQRLNDIENAAKTNDELPLLSPINVLSKIRASLDGSSGIITIQNIIDAAVTESQNLYNQFVTIGGFTLSENELTVNAGWSWILQGVNYANNFEQLFEIPFTAPGNTRIDVLIAISANNFSLLRGEESEGIPAAPAIPENTLQATFLIVTEDSISEPTEPAAVVNHYLGFYPSEEDLTETLRRAPLKNDWGWVVAEELFEVGIYSGSAWAFFNLNGGGIANGIDEVLAINPVAIAKDMTFRSDDSESPNNTAIIYSDGLSVNEASSGNYVTLTSLQLYMANNDNRQAGLSFATGLFLANRVPNFGRGWYIRATESTSGGTLEMPTLPEELGTRFLPVSVNGEAADPTGNITIDAGADTSYVDSAIAALIGGAPSNADTLNELNNKILAIQALFSSTPDMDNVVNTIAEVLAVLSTWPEGTNVLTALNLKFDKSDVYNALDLLVSGKSLDARQGKVLADAVGLRLLITDIYNALDQTASGKALDARQGRVLSDAVALKSNKKSFIRNLVDLNADNTTTALQKCFGSTANGSITLKPNTLYSFKLIYSVSGISATMGSFSFGFLGTFAASSNIYYLSNSARATNEIAPATLLIAIGRDSTAKAITTSSTLTNARGIIEGMIQTPSGSGYITPAFAFGNASSAIFSAGNIFLIEEISPSSDGYSSDAV